MRLAAVIYRNFDVVSGSSTDITPMSLVPSSRTRSAPSEPADAAIKLRITAGMVGMLLMDQNADIPMWCGVFGVKTFGAPPVLSVAHQW
jgi:hypothetical protein